MGRIWKNSIRIVMQIVSNYNRFSVIFINFHQFNWHCLDNNDNNNNNNKQLLTQHMSAKWNRWIFSSSSISSTSKWSYNRIRVLIFFFVQRILFQLPSAVRSSMPPSSVTMWTKWEQRNKSSQYYKPAFIVFRFLMSVRWKPFSSNSMQTQTSEHHRQWWVEYENTRFDSISDSYADFELNYRFSKHWQQH